MPLARMAMYQKGVQVYLAPTADARDSWQTTLKHIAMQGRIFLSWKLTANRIQSQNSNASQINISSLDRGVYFIRFRNEKITETIRFI
ncbi:MAG: hypothetical protein B6I19_10900 [Bacteroidetes bacterium 4572_114]|nr:MAG: hypothetical protein B6I19_10900 [Bacteroidetes bacterium 4572_114]